MLAPTPAQLHIFAVPYEEPLALYPLERVRELYISGGSWEESALGPGQKVRRDTHDGAVPAEVFQLLNWTMPRCPQLKYVVLEHLGNGLKTESGRMQLAHDFRQMESLVHLHRQDRCRMPRQLFCRTSLC